MIDFGLADTLTHCKFIKNFVKCGSPGYVAPEIIYTNNSYDYKVDVFSLGIVIYVLIRGEHMFKS